MVLLGRLWLGIWLGLVFGVRVRVSINIIVGIALNSYISCIYIRQMALNNRLKFLGKITVLFRYVP